MILSGLIAHVAPVSTAGELGETPRAKKLPEANRLVIWVVLRGGKDDAFLPCRLNRKLHENCVGFGASEMKGKRFVRRPRPSNGLATSQKLVYNLRPKWPAITPVTS